MKKTLSIFLSLFLMLSITTSCGISKSTTSENADESKQITDNEKNIDISEVENIESEKHEDIFIKAEDLALTSNEFSENYSDDDFDRIVSKVLGQLNALYNNDYDEYKEWVDIADIIRFVAVNDEYTYTFGSEDYKEFKLYENFHIWDTIYDQDDFEEQFKENFEYLRDSVLEATRDNSTIINNVTIEEFGNYSGHRLSYISFDFGSYYCYVYAGYNNDWVILLEQITQIQYETFEEIATANRNAKTAYNAIASYILDMESTGNLYNLFKEEYDASYDYDNELGNIIHNEFKDYNIPGIVSIVPDDDGWFFVEWKESYDSSIIGIYPVP